MDDLTLAAPLLSRDALLKAEDHPRVEEEGGELPSTSLSVETEADAACQEHESLLNLNDPSQTHEDSSDDTSSSSRWHVSWWLSLLQNPLCPEPTTWSDSSLAKLRLAKLFVVTLLGIVLTHLFVLDIVNWEHRKGLTLYDIWMYDGNSIVLDVVLFFVVGRLYHPRTSSPPDQQQHKHVDTLLFVGTMLTSSFYTSVLPNVWFLQHSMTSHEVWCVWPWQLWLFVGLWIVPACTGVVVLHVRYCCRSHQEDCGWTKLGEVFVSAVLCLCPQVLHEDFEFHHWFGGWLVGMHCNLDTWWSLMTMAWCWGQYVNGIGVWGRDPVLVCTYVEYLQERQQCGVADSGGDTVIFSHMVAAATSIWRNYSTTAG